ncbi:sulfatase-modifying factor enzyme 1 [Leptospira fainei serovar Hurstbridge str. BUT 6]|uniref:Sulfatase-modifying factor enzyme 1 n=1 Tax=Leptospira fainei serovar Hurstbridge str. BUT 6 TaxID=1193011 RepID=S3UVC4_9LEPT|nr:SUMF1/EgtB/PvdO family nonheme iron enzyme [Leptospira fainei]EPG74351.1 sulfatase-modifying factor enzyme 1 [Leptospira fainei serovar Hurstbridge str. BUT 6]
MFSGTKLRNFSVIPVKSRHLLALLCCILFLPYQGNSQDGETVKTLDTRKTILWTGEILGVYRNKGKVKIRIERNSFFADREEEEIRAVLDMYKRFPLLRKPKLEEIGSFSIENVEIEFEKVGRKTKPVSVEMRGSFSLLPGNPERLVAAGILVGHYGEEKFYQDPAAFDATDVVRNRPKKILLHPKDGKEMVLVSSGYESGGKTLYEQMGYFLFGQGSEPSEDSYNPFFDSPRRDTLEELSSFYIDKHEVTNKEYYRFLKETGTPPPPHWENGFYPKGKDYHPVVNLTYREAELYAKWTGKRVPSEFQWEKAARGTGISWRLLKDESYEFVSNPRDYPFGNEYDPVLCNTKESGKKETVSVFELSTKGESPFGALGMCGNAPEWTSSPYLPYKAHRLSSVKFGKHLRVIRGGSFSSDKEEAKSYSRDFGGIPNLSTDRKAGIRLIMELKK